MVSPGALVRAVEDNSRRHTGQFLTAIGGTRKRTGELAPHPPEVIAAVRESETARVAVADPGYRS
ncbi:hypothetical protein GCM10009836_21820 [Pseudonocardia ailaonensis]|uniref:Uncharacterized protein n=1 Tax=Pseudonocardia ailaonensis TaxID=367279 RepID=A0ABN2MXD4_9PSEU